MVYVYSSLPNDAYALEVQCLPYIPHARLDFLAALKLTVMEGLGQIVN